MPEDIKKDLLDEISQMDVIETVEAVDEGKGDSESKEVIEDAKKKTVETDKVGEAASDEESSEIKADKGEAEKSSEKPAEKPAVVVEKKSREDLLLAEIDRLSNLITESKLKGPEKLEIEEKTVEELSEDFVGGLDMDDVASNPSILNKILNAVIKKAVEIAGKTNASQLNGMVPQVVRNQVETYSNSKKSVDKFYDENPDLSNVRGVVKACAMQVVEESPDKKWEDVLKESAIRTRQTLGIVKTIETKVIDNPDDAAFAESHGHNRSKKAKVSSLQQQIDEL